METKSLTYVRQTDYRFRVLYAIAITMVVIGHGAGGLHLDLWGLVPYYSCHLAIFAFSSGYFYKPESESHPGPYLAKKAGRLIVPLYLYNLAYGLLVALLGRWGFAIGQDLSWESLLIAPVNNGAQFCYNMGGWFIVPLFMVQAVYVMVRKLIGFISGGKTSEWAVMAVFCVLGLAGNELACRGYYRGNWVILVRMTYFLPFYAMGYLYRTKLEKAAGRVPSVIWFGAVLLSKLLIIAVLGKNPVYTPGWCNDFTDGPLMPLLIGLLGIAFWLRAAELLEPMIGRKRWLNRIAGSTYSIMMNQFLGFMLVKSLFAAGSRFTEALSSFDWGRYKTDIWYFYRPASGLGLDSSILYLAAGIAVPVLIQRGIDFIRGKIRKSAS